ncbi:MAG: BrnA antitoxin family protein [Acidobacteriaceae bacterium]
MTDEEIDYSDIPSQKGMNWTRPGALIPAENKQQITLRLDADLLRFFKKTGSRYQSRINAVLREYVEAQKRAS